jgi:hypothetical protein
MLDTSDSIFGLIFRQLNGFSGAIENRVICREIRHVGELLRVCGLFFGSGRRCGSLLYIFWSRNPNRVQSAWS